MVHVVEERGGAGARTITPLLHNFVVVALVHLLHKMLSLELDVFPLDCRQPAGLFAWYGKLYGNVCK